MVQCAITGKDTGEGYYWRLEDGSTVDSELCRIYQRTTTKYPTLQELKQWVETITSIESVVTKIVTLVKHDVFFNGASRDETFRRIVEDLNEVSIKTYKKDFKTLCEDDILFALKEVLKSLKSSIQVFKGQRLPKAITNEKSYERLKSLLLKDLKSFPFGNTKFINSKDLED